MEHVTLSVRLLNPSASCMLGVVAYVSESFILRCIKSQFAFAALHSHKTAARLCNTHPCKLTQTVNQTSMTNPNRDTALFADCAPLHLWPGQGACMSVGCGCMRYGLNVSLKLCSSCPWNFGHGLSRRPAPLKSLIAFIMGWIARVMSKSLWKCEALSRASG